jgi:hypothetical protein
MATKRREKRKGKNKTMRGQSPVILGLLSGGRLLATPESDEGGSAGRFSHDGPATSAGPTSITFGSGGL